MRSSALLSLLALAALPSCASQPGAPADAALDATSRDSSLEAAADGLADASLADASLDAADARTQDAPSAEASSDALEASTDAASDAGSAPDAYVPSFCSRYPPSGDAGTWQARRVRYDASGRLAYVSDAEGNRVPDFSFAGYHQGEAPLPSVPSVELVAPGAGDDTARIQAALDRVAARTPDARGLRGAVALAPGAYQLAGTLSLRASGVVLRGAGAGADPASNSVLVATGDTPHQRNVVEVGAGSVGFWSTPRGPRVEVSTPRVLVNATSFDVRDATSFHPGDAVLLLRPSTAAWIAALGGGGGSMDWNPGEVDTAYYRHVVAVSGTRVTVDVPLYDTLDRSLSQAVLYAVDDAALLREVGVESLRIDVQTAGGTDENHAWSAVAVTGARDAWVRDVTALHFGYAAVVVEQSQRVTVQSCAGLDPVSVVTGGRRYNFAVERYAQQVLFQDCAASNGRHHYVSNGISLASGVVFSRSRSDGAYDPMEGHRRWSQALLYDLVVDRGARTPVTVGLYNRGDYGTFHGWAAVHSVLWRHDTGGAAALVQRPPLGQNYAFGVQGAVTGNGPFSGSLGYVEAATGALQPDSLYEAQLCDRLLHR